MRRAAGWPLAVAGSAAMLTLLVAAGIGGPLRLLLALWFLLVCTGMAFVPLLRIDVPELELAMGVGASVVLDTVVVTLVLLVGALSAASVLVALDGLCLVGCVLQIRPEVRRCS